MSDNAQLTGLCDRFRGFYPVVIDVETAGFNAKTDALLEKQPDLTPKPMRCLRLPPSP